MYANLILPQLHMNAYLQAYPTATCLNYAFASLTLELWNL